MSFIDLAGSEKVRLHTHFYHEVVVRESLSDACGGLSPPLICAGFLCMLLLCLVLTLPLSILIGLPSPLPGLCRGRIQQKIRRRLAWKAP
jgi:hypothetical protein